MIFCCLKNVKHYTKIIFLIQNFKFEPSESIQVNNIYSFQFSQNLWDIPMISISLSSLNNKIVLIRPLVHISKRLSFLGIRHGFVLCRKDISTVWKVWVFYIYY
jgi:hypothetical protein